VGEVVGKLLVTSKLAGMAGNAFTW
jgi:hypothetical protein